MALPRVLCRARLILNNDIFVVSKYCSLSNTVSRNKTVYVKTVRHFRTHFSSSLVLNSIKKDDKNHPSASGPSSSSSSSSSSSDSDLDSDSDSEDGDIFPDSNFNIPPPSHCSEKACLTACTSGMLLAWPSPFIPKITNDHGSYNITKEQASYFTILNLIGLMVSLPFTTYFPDAFGRKPTLMLSALPYLGCWILKLFFTNLYVLYLARFLSGTGDAFLFSSLPLYIGEVAAPRVRGIWGNGIIVLGYFGQLLINVLGTYLNIIETCIVSLLLPLLFLVSFSFMPESPYFYVMKERDEEAKISLRTLKLKEDVDEDFAILKSDVRRQLSESGTMKDLFFIAGVFLRTSQMFSGMFVFVSYTQLLFEKAGGNIEPSISAIIYVGLAFVLFCAASVFAEKLGRKKSLTISFCLTAVVLLAEGLYFWVEQYVTEIDLSDIKWFPLAGMLFYLLFCCFGVAIIPTLMLSELFSASIKAKAISVVVEFYALSYLLMNILFYQFTLHLGLYAPFLVFGCCNIISAILAMILVPETKGRTLEDIQQNLKAK